MSYLLHNLILFGRTLHAMGMEVTPGRMISLVEACKHIDIRNRNDFKTATRTILVSHHAHWELFDRVFDLFWQAAPPDVPASADLGVLLRKTQQIKEQIAANLLAEESRLEESVKPNDEPPEKRYTYSRIEALHHKDFSELTPEELQQVRVLLQKMSWDLERRRTRRRISGSRGSFLDMRRTLRSNLRYGGEPLLLQWRYAKRKRRRLVVLCDISGSMEPYSRLLLQFIYVISQGLRDIEAFVFGTRLTRITYHLKERDVNTALREASGAIQDWGGGTRIGEALKTFNYQWARRVRCQGAIVLLISDGWDRGDVPLLEKEISRLQRNCHRLIWLNPLLGSPRYEPLTRGMRAALPHLDDFLPVHNLASLEQLGDSLAQLAERRPLRRQGKMVA